MEPQDIKLQLLMLEAQKEGLETQIKRLKEIKCPTCKGIGEITHPNQEEGSWLSERCEACEGSGYLCGERSPGWSR